MAPLERRVFVDTSAWLALHDEGQWSQRALRKYRELLTSRARLVTTNWVYYETLSRLKRPGSKLPSLFREAIHLSKVHVVNVTTTQELYGVKEFFKHHDKAWSVVDCVSFVVIRDPGTRCTEALAYDHHFVQAQREFRFSVIDPV